MKSKVILITLMIISCLFIFSIRSYSINSSTEETTNSNLNKITNNKTINTSSKITISEVVAMNKSIIKDEYFNYSDYIEIFNYSNEPVNLKNYGLTDDTNFPFKWTFPDKEIQPNSYILVFADEKDTNAKYLHTNFSLDETDCAVMLASPDGKELSQVKLDKFAYDLSLSIHNNSYSYYETGSPFDTPSQPPIDDIDNFFADLEEPIILSSHKAGFYSDEFLLSLSTNSKHTTIRYTLDGSSPIYSSPEYTDPLKIETRDNDENVHIPFNQGLDNIYVPSSDQTKRATIVKARCFVGHDAVGEEFTATYFVDESGQNLYSFPVVSLITNPKNFWSNSRGIYSCGLAYIDALKDGLIEGKDEMPKANYEYTGDSWRRKCHFEYFDDGSLVLSQDLGVQIFGNYSRHFDKKSLKLITKDYSDKNICYPFFDDNANIYGNQISSYDSIVLRSGGSEACDSLIRDCVVSSIAEPFLDVQAAQPIIVFLDGEYYGIHFIRESINPYYIESHYSIPEESIGIVKNIWEYQNTGLRHFHDLIRFSIENDMSIDKNYEYLKQYIDMENYIEYYVLEMYIGNTDWPQNNTRFWRKLTDSIDDEAPYGQDGRYRTILFDTDYGLDPERHIDFNTFEHVFVSGEDNALRRGLVKGLIENEDFKNQFITKFCDRLNSDYSAEPVIKEIEYWKELIEPEVEEDMIRYGNWDLDINNWYNEIQQMINFANERPDQILKQMADFFDKSISILTINNTCGGKIIINDTITIEKGEVFTGKYLTDVPMKITAVATNGYKFVKWSNNETQENLSFTFTEQDNKKTFTPIFEKVN